MKLQLDMSLLSVLTIGDPHFKLKNRVATTQMGERLRELIGKLSPDLIVVLGDTLHTHETTSSPVLRRALDFLRMLSEQTQVILLIGNHDLINNRAVMVNGRRPDHFFEAVHEWPNITVVDEAKLITVKGYKLAAVPYVPNGHLISTLDELLIGDKPT